MKKPRSRLVFVALLCVGTGLLAVSPAATAASSSPALGTYAAGTYAAGTYAAGTYAAGTYAAGTYAAGTYAAGTYVKAYAAFLGTSQLDLFPVDVQATSDGGAIALALAQSPAGLGVDWLVKLRATGAPQWQEEVGCAGPSGAPGDNADGVSLQQTGDGGYIVGGGTIDCGAGRVCPPLSALSCALVEKLTPAGKLAWARVYHTGFSGSISQIRQTADGGYIAVGSFLDPEQRSGALILKLDGRGNVQWERVLGPSGHNEAYFNAVQQTSGGGYVATGDFYRVTTGVPRTQVLAARFGPNGNLRWQRGFATLRSNGTFLSTADAQSIVQAPGGGYAIAGAWTNSYFPGEGSAGGLLLKLSPGGDLRWQKAYSGGVYCYDNGYSETCADIGAVAYSLHVTSDGGFVLAGDGRLELSGSIPQVPWLAETDASGNLRWQHFYYQTYTTGSPLSQFFASSALAPGGGFLSAGPTEDYPAQRTDLFVVRTGGSGLAGSCGDVHPATPLTAISPAMTAVAPSLSVRSGTTSAASSPIATLPTSVTTQSDC